MRFFGTPLLLLGFLAAQAATGDEPKKPEPKFPLGKETTYVTGPLDQDGYIDYQAALNERLGQGVKPDKNANVLLWKALGPRPEGGHGMPPAFFKALGIEEPAEGGDYLVGLAAFIKDHLKLDQAEAIEDQRSRASLRPWTAKDYPHVAAWLQANEKPLAVAVEAAKRPDYFNPLISREKGPGSLINVLLPGVQKCRELAGALSARAMLRAGEGNFDEAWQDLLACHRLARLVARGATLIEALVGIAIDQMAANADLAYLEHAVLTAKQVRERLKDLQGLPPLAPIADKIDLGERFMFLDCLQLVRQGGIGMMEGLAGGPVPKKPDAKEQQALAAIDWEPALSNGNRWYDRMASIMRVKERAGREMGFDRLEVDLRELKNEAVKQSDVLKALRGGEDPGKRAGKVVGDVMIGLLMPAVRKVQNAYDRAEQVQRNLHLAFALAAFRLDAGRYPAKLDELAPRYLAEVPGDLFSGQALVYRPAENGYLLYSVGVNGKDEEGRWLDDDPPGDDLSVRMPLPELKPKK